MQVVWKIEFTNNPEGTTVMLPGDARAVHVGCDDALLSQVWLLCTIDAPPRQRSFVAIPPGGTADDTDEYVGTWVAPNGNVGHIFERTSP